MRMDAGNAEGKEPSEDLDPVATRLVRLHMDQKNGNEIWIGLMRDLAWIEGQNAKKGAILWLDLPHVGIRGEATVIDIEPCPRIEKGPGRLVTGTFRQSKARVFDLMVEGEPKPIGVTGTHPFWSG